MKIFDAFVINIGIFNECVILCVKEVIKYYKVLNKFIVLDFVGCFVSVLCYDISLEFLKSGGVSAFRGNVVELGFLVGIFCESKGLDFYDVVIFIEMVKWVV